MKARPPAVQRLRLAERLVDWRLLLLGLSLVSLIPATELSSRLSFDQRIESLYTEDDPHLRAYAESKRLFGGDEFAIVAWEERELFDERTKGLPSETEEEIRSFAEELSQVEGVKAESTQHLADALAFPYKREQVRELMRGVLLGEKGRTTAIVLRLQPQEEAEVDRGETIARIRELADAHDPPAFVVGEPVQIHDMFRYVEQDGGTLFLWSLVVLATVIFVYFRSVRWVVLPLLIVAASVLWTRALLVLVGAQLSMVSSMLNSLVTIIGVATVTHVTVHYRERRRERAREPAFRTTFVALLPPVFWMCTTTAVGFAALLSSHITPVRSFGLMVALATGLVLVAVATILPGGALTGRFSADPKDAPAEAGLSSSLERITRWTHQYPVPLGVGTLALTLFAAVGFTRLDVETDFSKNFRESSPIIQSLNFVESRMGGAGSWEVNFPVPGELNEEVLNEVRQLAERLREEHGGTGPGAVTKVVALTDGLDLVPQRVKLGPFTREFDMPTRLKLLSNLQPEFVPSLYNPDAGRMRIVLRSLERQPSESRAAIIGSVESTAREQFPEAKATGLFVLLTFLIQSLLRDQLVSFCLAATGIVIVTSIAFWSVRIGLISLIPNLFPIVLVVGGMGWMGMPVNIATAMIACISVGLTTDATIHFVASYQRGRASGLSPSEATDSAMQGTGRALVFADLALVAGFCVLMLSQFIPLVHFGMLVSLAMLGGLLGDLFLLPPLLERLDRKARAEAAPPVSAGAGGEAEEVGPGLSHTPADDAASS